jgi:hypothetical protein
MVLKRLSVAHHAELGAILLAAFMTLSYFAGPV